MIAEETEYDEGDITEFYACTWIKEWNMFAWLNINGEYYDYIENGVIHFDTNLFLTYPICEENTQNCFICGNILTNPEFIN